MNRLNIFAGGHPVYKQDFDHIQGAWRQGFEALAKGLCSGLDKVIVTGCEVTDNGGTLDIADGFIYWNSEVWKVNGATNLPNIITLGLVFTASYDAPDPYVYANSSSYSVLEVRELNFATSGIDFGWTEVKTLGQAFVEQSGSAVYFGDSLVNGTAGTYAPYYKKNRQNQVRFGGQIIIPASSFSSTSSTPLVNLYQIPNIVKPLDYQTYTVGMYDGKVLTLVLSNNSMYLNYPVGFSADFLLNLSAVSYFTRN